MGVCSGVRPYGVSLLVAGFDEQGPQLYQVRPPSLWPNTFALELNTRS